MKSYRKELWFNIPSRRGFLNITPDVEAALRESGIREGFVLINAMHITSSVFINDDEHGLHQDYDKSWVQYTYTQYHRLPRHLGGWQPNCLIVYM